ncbi:hypothetical protein SELMODRAFT_411417 [Selaginella moellendorffii]|uniref:Uncharacterized protein n=1 Tax=Selaginella moellendorffii TaxID=88036 RepID=D8RHV2_SELML|nr:hypothetical protein SELMODRAFT_411417 [Selaginella moellendorffii]
MKHSFFKQVLYPSKNDCDPPKQQLFEELIKFARDYKRLAEFLLILLTPEQTTTIVITTDQPTSCPRCHTCPCIPYITTTTVAVLEYITCNMKSSAFATPDTLIKPFFNDTNTTRFSGSLWSLASLQTRSTSRKAWTRSDMRDLECLPRSCGPLWSYDLVAAQNETTKVYDFQLLSMETLTAQHECNEGCCGSQGPLQLQGDPWRKLYQVVQQNWSAILSYMPGVYRCIAKSDMEWHEGVSCGVGYIDVASINLQNPQWQKT